MEHATTEAPPESAHTSPAMAPPKLPQPTDASQVANGGNDFGSLAVMSGRAAVQSSASGEGRARKRRRVEDANLRTPSQACQQINQIKLSLRFDLAYMILLSLRSNAAQGVT